MSVSLKPIIKEVELFISHANKMIYNAANDDQNPWHQKIPHDLLWMFYSYGNQPQKPPPVVPTISIVSNSRKVSPCWLRANVWKSDQQAALQALAQNQTVTRDPELTIAAKLFEKPTDEIYRELLLMAYLNALGNYHSATGAQQRISKYNVHTLRFFGIKVDPETSRGAEGYRDIIAVRDNTLAAEILDTFPMNPKVFKVSGLSPTTNKGTGSSLKKWGCLGCGSSVRSAKGFVEIQCVPCDEPYYYVDRDMHDIYQSWKHSKIPDSDNPGNCKLCGKNQATKTNACV